MRITYIDDEYVSSQLTRACVYFSASYIMTRFFGIMLLISALIARATAGVMSSLGSVLSVGTGFLPPEMRGMAGTVANAALAKQNRERGIIEVAPDGSDYPWICLCATPKQFETLKKTVKDYKSISQCPEDLKMGCRTPQVNMDAAPLPAAPNSSPTTR